MVECRRFPPSTRARPEQAGGGHRDNTFGELATQVSQYSGTPLVNITYHASGTAQRDALGRIVQKTEIIGGTPKVFTYEYDTLGRLEDVFIDAILDEHFGYDTNGNRTTHFSAATGLTVTPTYDDQDRLLTYGTWAFTYTENGELETKTNTATNDEWIFGYDVLGNLLSVGLPSGDLVEHLVDGAGRRVAKKLNGVVTKQWIYRDALKPVAELDGAGNLVAQFVYGTKSNVPDYVRRGGSTYRVVSDHLGSPRYVVNVASAGDVPFTANYTAFGSVTGTGLDWMPFGFAGGIYDADSGLVRFGARDYDPSVGRWTAKEPLRFRGGRNFYAYALNDPVNRWDPDGLQSVPAGCGGASSGSSGGSEGTGGIEEGPTCRDPWTPDWCGSRGSEWVPESDPLGTSNYSEACRSHDECYGRCGSDRFECDWDLGHDMQSQCREQGDPCEVAGFVYWGFVNGMGQTAYDNAQADCVCQ